MTLVEPLAEAEGSRVIVTGVHPAETVDLRERGMDESQAADLRRRLASFAEDWDTSLTTEPMISPVDWARAANASAKQAKARNRNMNRTDDSAAPGSSAC